MLVLISGSDQYMPKTVDKEGLFSRWSSFMKDAGVALAPGSGVVKDADHALTDCPVESKADAAQRIASFLKHLDRL